MAPYVACHIGLLGLKSRIHNVYTVPCGTEKKPKAQGGNGVRGSFLPSPLLPTIFLPFVPPSSIINPAVLQTMRPTVCAPEQAEVFVRRCRTEQEHPSEVHPCCKRGKEDTCLSPALLTQGFTYQVCFHLLHSPRMRSCSSSNF